MASLPKSPREWKAYAESDALADIPLKTASPKDDGGVIATYRDLYMDAAPALGNKSAHTLYIYSDVLALEGETVIEQPSYAAVKITTRVLTADAPTRLKVKPTAGSECWFTIYASILDQPITVSTDSSEVQLELGPGTGNAGVVVGISDKGISPPEYLRRNVGDEHEDSRKSLQTQLRASLAFFWKDPPMAISLCSHVAASTMQAIAPDFCLVNAQAVALGQQLAAAAMTDSDTSYAPALELDRYTSTLEKGTVVLRDYEEEYERFEDKADSLEHLKEVAQAMLAKASDERNAREGQAESAKNKYESASATAESCRLQMEKDNGELDRAGVEWKVKLEQWEERQKLKAVFDIFAAIVTFAVSVGTICFGGAGAGAAAGEVDQAVEIVEGAAEEASKAWEFVSSDTLKKLGDCSKALQVLYTTISKTVKDAEGFAQGFEDTIPPKGDISGSDQGDADSAAIVSLSSWDQWTLEADESMRYAVDNIPGAGEYRLVLRKHAVIGKQLAQAQAEAVKAGQEYVHAVTDVGLCDQNVARLTDLLAQWDEESYAEAAAGYYDLLMGLRISLVLDLRNVVWAYKYYALQDSSITLDSKKSADAYSRDIYTIQQDINKVDSDWGLNFQSFDYIIPSTELPSNYHSQLIESLRDSPAHEASFALAPHVFDPNTDIESFASQFVEGSHYRLNKLDVTLEGVRPLGGQQIVKLEIRTSGIYYDIRDDKVFAFAGRPLYRRYSYVLKENGHKGEIRETAEFDTKNHAEPTPFTKWDFKLLEAENFDMSRLEGVKTEWHGCVRLGQAALRRMARNPT